MHTSVPGIALKPFLPGRGFRPDRMPRVWEVPARGQAADLVVLHWNRLAAQPERFEQRFKGSDHRHGRLATARRFQAIPDAC